MQAMHLKELDANLLVVLDALLFDASVTKAAERLGRSPSAVSHALANLRELFGDELFVRAGQRLVPTSKANEVAPTVHVIVSGMESLLRPSTPFDPATQERCFILACRETGELTLLQKLRETIRPVAPNIRLGWKQLHGRDSLEDLRASSVQFVIIEGEPEDDTADFVWSHLYDESYVTLGRRRHPLTRSKKPAKAFADFEHVFVMPNDGGSDFVQAHLEQNDISTANEIWASSVFVALFLLLDTDRLATVPKSVADAVAKKIGLIEIDQPFEPLALPNYFGWHRSQDRDECHEWVRQQLLDMFTVANGKAKS